MRPVTHKLFLRSVANTRRPIIDRKPLIRNFLTRLYFPFYSIAIASYIATIVIVIPHHIKRMLLISLVNRRLPLDRLLLGDRLAHVVRCRLAGRYLLSAVDI
jgi:hypothetical protein